MRAPIPLICENLPTDAFFGDTYWPLRDPDAARAGEHGRGLSRPRHRARHEVAIKVLPAAFVADPERLARFQREAQALAALSHPRQGGAGGFACRSNGHNRSEEHTLNSSHLG